MTQSFEELEKMIQNAPEAGGASFKNFGQLTTKMMIVTWAGPKDKRVPTRTEYVPGVPMPDGANLEIAFSIDVQEFQPTLDFLYERNVSVRASSARAKTSWSEIVKPSLEAVFGKGWLAKLLTESRPYVCALDELQVEPPGKSGKMFNTIKFVAVYKDKAACLAAFEAQKIGNGAPSAGVIPASVVDAVKQIATALGGNVTVLKAALGSDAQYAAYGVDALVAAAGL